MNKRFMNWLRHPSDNSATAAIVLLIVGGLIVVLGYDYLHSGLRLRNVAEDFYANASTELISIAITVLVIDQLNQRRARHHEQEQERIAHEVQEAQEKKRLILQMGSPNKAFAVEAVRALRARGWGFEKDESLHGASLAGADLEGANLQDANLQGADLTGADLQDVHLPLANLKNAFLSKADLRGAFLAGANLCGANLVNANLRGAQIDIEKAYTACSLDETTILPDFHNYIPKKGMEQLHRFTDPDHPDFWQPESNEDDDD